MIQEIKDRVPVNVLSNDAIRYGIYDEQGNLVRYEYIKREDEPVENGTPINKGLFNNLQGDLYTQDRYNKLNLSYEPIDEVEVHTDNLFENMEEVSQSVCKNDFIEVTLNKASTLSGNSVALAFDGNGNTSAQTDYITSTQMIIECMKKIKINKFYIYSSGNLTFTIKGCNSLDDDGVTLYTSTNSNIQNEVELQNADYFKYYIFNYSKSGDSVKLWIFSVEIREWEGQHFKFKGGLSLPLTSYEVGKIVNIEGSKMWSDNGLFTEDIVSKSWEYVSDTKYIAEDGTILSAGYISSASDYPLSNVCDGSDTSFASIIDSNNGETTGYVRLELPSEIKVTKMKCKYLATNISTAKIQGSKDGDVWVDLYSTTSSLSSNLTEVTLSNVDYFKFYQLVIEVTSGGATVSEFQTSEIVGSYVTSFKNPYLNINNLGAKQINGTIEAGEKYSLVYNGESWDIAKTKVVTGSFAVGQNTKYTINIGFTPDLVIIYSRYMSTDSMAYSNASATWAMAYNPVILTKAYVADSSGVITENGFTKKTSNTAGQSTLYYIAIKF